MIVAAHPPCYFPDLTILHKMCKADVFVLADDIQYTKHDLINRAKIKTAQGAAWLTVPVRTKNLTNPIINRLKIDTNQNWRRKHWRSLVVNYKYAAYFDKYADFFEQIYNQRWLRLLDLNLAIMEYLRQCLKITTKTVHSSELSVEGKGRERLIKMLQKLNCRKYTTEARFKNYLSETQFAESGIELSFLSCQHSPYHQQFGDFIPGLSTIDLLFNEGDMSYDIIMGA